MTSIVSLINYRYHVKRTQPNWTLLIMVLEHEALKELLTVTMELWNIRTMRKTIILIQHPGIMQ